MKIYFVLEYLEGQGGVESVVTQVVKALERRGVETTVLLAEPSLETEWEKELPRVHYYDKHRTVFGVSRVMCRVRGLNRLLGKIGYPDIIVGAYTPWTTLYSRFCIPQNSKIPIISWLHMQLMIFDNTRHLHYADWHWCISEEIAYGIVQITKRSENITWVGNPVCLKVKPIPISKENHFVYIGRVEIPGKRLDLLLSALMRLKVDWHLDLYGNGTCVAEVKELIQTLNLQSKVTLKGFVKNPWEEIKSCKALLLASDFESFGMVLVEAISRGIPVISTACGGPQTIINADNGWLVPTGDVEAYTQALEKIIALSEEELQRQVQKAALSLERFDEEKVIDRMLIALNGYRRAGDTDDH